MWHVREDLIDDDFHIDQAGLDAVGRMGGPFYTRALDPFALRIPDWKDLVDKPS